MSAKAAEYLKRTCLICGCHTNETINIYEPRSGPNIVQLIQAKFKFQPLNDDKYLCFSCNNWLINWHSLQALNSNDTESPSGTVRSQVNMVAQEKQQHKAQESTQLSIVKPMPKCRPIARVSPRVAIKPTNIVSAINNPTTTPTTTMTSNSNTTTSNTNNISTKNNVKNKITNKHTQQTIVNLPRNLKLFRSICKICKHRIVCVIRTKQQQNIVRKCKKCYKAQNFKHNLPKKQQPQPEPQQQHQQLVDLSEEIVDNNDNVDEALNVDVTRENLLNIPKSKLYQHNQRWQPILDGKVVSKLRRLGTSLARDAAEGKLVFLSVAKEKPQWERQLDSDEILLDFNTTISEVLPIAQRNQHKQQQQQQQDTHTSNNCAAQYPITSNVSKNLGEKFLFTEEFDQQLPKGLTISLVSY